MSKVFLVHGEEPFLIYEKIKELLPKEQNDFNVERYDMRETDIADVLLSANQISFLDTGEKIILLNDCYFLSSEKGSNLTAKEEEMLLEYINDPGAPSTLILKGGKIDKRKKLVKALQKVAIEHEMKPIAYPQTWITKHAKTMNLKLDKQAADKMFSDLGSDLFLLHNELCKVATYYDGTTTITAEMLEPILTKTLEQDIFILLNSIVEGNPNAITLLQDLLQSGNDPIQITLVLSSLMQTLELIKIAEIQGLKSRDLLPKMQPYAIQKNEEKASQFSLAQITQKIKELGELELKMKRGEVEKVTALETMILKW